MPTSLSAVSLFSGAGGLDLGLKKAGFDFVTHIENDQDACQTLTENGFKNVVHSDVKIEKLTKISLPPQLDLLVGGPPCQPFSKSSQWSNVGAKGFKDTRASTIDDFIDSVNVLAPRAFLLENVPQFKGMGGVDRVIRKLDRRFGGEYEIIESVLNAAHFGVAQNRVRIFVVGLRSPARFKFPYIAPEKYKRTVWDYLCGIPSPKISDVRGKWTPLLPSIPPGSNYLYHTKRGDGLPLFGWRTRYWSFLYKLDPAGISPTIVANPAQNNGPFHWENRDLSERELASIQSFPRTYRFHGDRQSIRRQIGNAVPPLLAEHLGWALSRALGCTPPARLSLLPRRAKTRPHLPELTAVPKSFEALVGEYPDHPGAGLGPKPRR